MFIELYIGHFSWRCSHISVESWIFSDFYVIVSPSHCLRQLGGEVCKCAQTSTNPKVSCVMRDVRNGARHSS